jgi:hypothetical protein
MKNPVSWDVTSCALGTDALEELIASITRVKRISELGTTLAIIRN